MGSLFIIATPIGNLKDITLRGLDMLKTLDYLLTEDTRVTAKLLQEYDINIPLISYHQHTSDTKKLDILKLLLDGSNVGLVTDAGTPGVSDPGNELIDFLLEKDSSIKIIPVPGVSSITTALSVCGFKAGSFSFLGYFPKKGKTKLLERVKTSEETIVFFDSPYRLKKNLLELEHILEERRICVAQELTKMHERIVRGRVSEVLDAISQEEKSLGRVKGEIVVVIEGN